MSRRCGRPVGVGFFAVLPMAFPASSLSRSALRHSTELDLLAMEGTLQLDLHILIGAQ